MEDANWYFDRYGGVDEIVRDANFDDHVQLGDHRVRFAEVLQCYQDPNGAEFAYNTGYSEGDRGAPLIMLGYTRKGRFLLTALVPSDHRGVWLAWTAYEPDSKYYEGMYWDFKRSLT
ncbi:MAG: hypothetical protein ACR2JC_00550 [Chloroflexota bacterium]